MEKKRLDAKKELPLNRQKKLGALLLSFFLSFSVFANPNIHNIPAGNVQIHQAPNTLIINQSSPKAIINWRNFNIGKQESTHFQQPRGGMTLNRISPTDGVSQIYGRLSATGKIILINPAGIYFGSSAVVNVGGLIATTADLSDQNFLKGNYQFTKVPGYSGSIINEGQITAAKHGLVALVAPGVVNKGKIEANLGHVVLASGEAFTVNFSGDNLINFAITGKTTRQGVDKDGKPLRDGVRNTGSLIANGGKVIISASAAQGVLDHVINMEGVAQARSVSKHNGEIIFSGDPDSGIVRVAAKVDASGKVGPNTGGKVKITGHQILIDDPTVIDVRGKGGGGDIYIGGNYQGKGPLPNAKAVVVKPSATMLADAIERGDGGTVIIWSDEVTKVHGTISAKGGRLQGNGGFVETSSHDYLDIAGITVDTRAPQGNKGTWLLDPRNVFITQGPTSGGTFSGVNPNIFTPNSDDSIIANTDIMNNLATANVYITTGATGAQEGNISVDAPISWVSSNSLRLDAFNKIFLNAAITAPNGTLELIAANTPQSITSGTSASPNPAGVIVPIDVANFRLLQGSWYQNNAALPDFNVSNNFSIAKGGPINGTFNATFTRFQGGNGTSSPFQITDVYGLGGVQTLDRTNNYVLNNNLDLASTIPWNDGDGFGFISPPSRNSVFSYLGTFDGQNHLLSNVTLNNPGDLTDTGLFPNIGTTGVVQNLGLINITVSAFTPDDSSVGTLAGANSGTLSNVYALGGSVSSTSPNSRVGGLVGTNFGPGVISNAYADIDVNYLPIGGNASIDRSAAGGLVGINITDSSISNAYSLGTVTFSGNNSSIGGFVGLSISTGDISNSLGVSEVNAPSGSGNQIGGFIAVNLGSGSVRDSFWDTDISGEAQGYSLVNPGSIVNLQGGCFGGACTILPGANSSNPGAPVDLSLAATYGASGWNIAAAPNAAIWNIVDTHTYPFLRSLSSAISGSTGVAAVNPVNFALLGTVIETSNTDASGTFYGVLPFGELILAYSPGSTGAIGNALFDVAAANNPNIPSLSLVGNRVFVDSAQAPSSQTIAETTGAITSGILYSILGTDLILDNDVSFVSANTYTLDGNITTSGSGEISFLSPALSQTSDVSLSTDQGSIHLAGVNGTGFNLNLTSSSGGNFNLSGSYQLNSIFVNGTNNNNLVLSTVNPQVFSILSPNAGIVTGIPGLASNLTFTNINNLQGGSASNTFIFSDQARLDGSLVGGTHANATHTLNTLPYQSSIGVTLDSLFSGTVFTGDTRITGYSSIQNLMANGLLDNSLTLPNKANQLTITGIKQGFINDPLFFSGFNTFISTSGMDSVLFQIPAVISSNNRAVVDGSPLFFTNFNLSNINTTSIADIADVMQQVSGDVAGPSTNIWPTDNVDQNINDLMKQIDELYDTKLDESKISPYCAGL